MKDGLMKAPSLNTPLTIAIAGCGKMGSAMVRAWLQSPFIAHIDILNPSPIKDEFNVPKISGFTNQSAFMKQSGIWDILVLAIKPQIMDDFCPTIASQLADDVCVLSIVTGKTLDYYARQFGNNQPIVRAMPNSPSAIGKGMTVACHSKGLSDDDKSNANFMLSCLGKTEWIEDEILIDAVTAVSGSGPAYVFYLIEALAEAGIQSGLNANFSMSLARQTVIGAAALADDGDLPASKLRENVTSPNGTTAAALSVLMNGEFQDILSEAVAKATGRSKELSR